MAIPESLDPVHAALLRELHFESAGALEFVIRGFAYEGLRVIYAITNPERTALVYIGDSEQGRNLRGRLKAHLRDREKIGHVERESFVFVHVLVTEFMALTRFEQETGVLPVCNHHKSERHPVKRNDIEAIARFTGRTVEDIVREIDDNPPDRSDERPIRLLNCADPVLRAQRMAAAARDTRPEPRSGTVQMLMSGSGVDPPPKRRRRRRRRRKRR